MFVAGSMTHWKSHEMHRPTGETDFITIIDCEEGMVGLYKSYFICGETRHSRLKLGEGDLFLWRVGFPISPREGGRIFKRAKKGEERRNWIAGKRKPPKKAPFLVFSFPVFFLVGPLQVLPRRRLEARPQAAELQAKGRGRLEHD